MHGVSEVIAIILILMITISIAGLAYTFMSSTMSTTTSAASSAVDSTASSMLTSFTIENIDVTKVYLRNTGQAALSSLGVYVNDEPTMFNIIPTTINSGDIGTITIYSFIPDGATVKVTSPNGFSASKVATPCSKSIACWKFDEGSGMIAYDSSPYGNSGTLINGTAWISGRYGNALQFDGINDYVSISNISNSYPISISYWVKTNFSNTACHFNILSAPGNYVLGGTHSGYSSYLTSSTTNKGASISSFVNNDWNFVVYVQASPASVSVFINGVNVTTDNAGTYWSTGQNSSIGRRTPGGALSAYYINGIIDEMYVFNKAIY